MGRRRQFDVKIKTTIDRLFDHTKMMAINQRGTMTQHTRQRIKKENESIEGVDNGNFSWWQLHAADKNKCRIIP